MTRFCIFLTHRQRPFSGWFGAFQANSAKFAGIRKASLLLLPLLFRFQSFNQIFSFTNLPSTQPAVQQNFNTSNAVFIAIKVGSSNAAWG
jgi:hypothetical protein